MRLGHLSKFALMQHNKNAVQSKVFKKVMHGCSYDQDGELWTRWKFKGDCKAATIHWIPVKY